MSLATVLFSLRRIGAQRPEWLVSEPATHIEYTWELEPNELASVFMLKGWKYGTTSVAVLPKHIQDAVEQSVQALLNGGGSYAELGRFVIFRDVEFPGGFEIAMKLGYVQTEVPDDLDTVPTSGAA